MISLQLLADLITIKHGYAFKGEFFRDAGEQIVVTPGNFHEEGGFRFRPGKEKFYAGPIPPDYVLNRGDVIVAMTEQGEGLLGSTAIVPQSDRFLHNQRLGLIRPKEGVELDLRFIYYLFNTRHVRQQIRATASGAKVRHTSPSRIGEVKAPIPSIDVQRRIASILSAYDDLIENNTRRIAILEEMARRIYEEWFVRFRFPGHEQVKSVESELGLIPEGWSIEKLGNLLEHHIGGGWGEESESEDFPVAAYVIRGTDIPDVRVSTLGRSPLRYHKESNFRTRKLQPKDIVFEVSGGSKDQPVGRAVLLTNKLFQSVDQPIICASFCRLVRANQKAILPELLKLHFERIYENREIMRYQTQSTGITNFKFTVFLEKEMVLVPPSNLQEYFSKSVLPLYDLASTLGTKNTNLRATRDLLLPKLISGELDVSTLPEPEAA
ncbi:MAG: restriction endonuclease subunit S [Thauera sp.]|nr:restriction endonuclease subunit S [Thauera sp.]